MPASEEHEYVLGTDDDELLRLGFQHQVWSREAALGWENAGFAPGHRILDVGCGPGYATFDLARLVTAGGHVHGVDVSQRFIAHLLGQVGQRGVTNISAEVMDVEKMQLEERRFHGAYARWVLCFVARPDAVIQSVSSALEPGGVFVVQDYCHYEGVTIAPPHPIFARTFAAVASLWRRRGGDPEVGARVPEMMIKAGLEIRSVRSISRVGRAGTALWHWPTTFFANFLPVLVEAGVFTAEEKETFEQEWAKRSTDPAAYFSTPPMVEVAAVKV